MKSNSKNALHLFSVVFAMSIGFLPSVTFAAGFVDYPGMDFLWTCMDKIGSDPVFQPLMTNFRSGERPPFVRYAMTSKPTQSEKVLIAKQMSDIDACRNSVDAKKLRQEHGDPITNQIFEASYSSYVGLVVRLYNGEITYGEYHKLGDQGFESYKALGDARLQEMKREKARDLAARTAQEQQAEAERQARAERVRQQTTKEFERALRPIAPPITTNCSTFGGNTSCVTR